MIRILFYNLCEFWFQAILGRITLTFAAKKNKSSNLQSSWIYFN